MKRTTKTWDGRSKGGQADIRTKTGTTPGGRSYNVVEVKKGGKVVSTKTRVISPGGHWYEKHRVGPAAKEVHTSLEGGYQHLPPGSVVKKRFRGSKRAGSGKGPTKPLKK